MPVLVEDYETFSVLDLRDVGAAVYAEHRSTGVWLIGYAIDDGPVEIWHPGDPVPQARIEAARDPAWTVVRHNDAFERSVDKHILAPRYGFPPVPIERHRCTMAAALACALPGKLEKLGEILSLTSRKDAEGARLMQQMARPRKPRKGEDPNGGPYYHDEPEKIMRLGAYCKQDVEAERELYHRLPPLSDSEQALWVLDAKINDRGFYTDGALLDAAAGIAGTAHQAMQDELVRLSGGALTSTDQVAALQAWLAGNGCTVKDLQKATLTAALRRKDLDPAARRAIELRLGASPDTKVYTMLARRSADGRIRGTLRFHGAGTGRWSATGLQVQNFTRDPGDIDGKIAAVLAPSEPLGAAA